VVAQEAGVPPSAVTYYFPSVDDLLAAALAAGNDEYLRTSTSAPARRGRWRHSPA
jgi:DNA-binding transcriptional regulator YbjK